MPAYLPYEASVRNACNFILNSRDTRNLYFGLAKNTIWGTPDTPPLFDNTNREKLNYWDDLIGGIRRIDKRDIIPIIPRKDWVNGQSYVLFDSDLINPYDLSFYVINSLNEVFTVNTIGVGNSTIEPTLADVVTGTGLATMTDGYIWKYQYTCNPYEISEVVSNWIPVNFSDTLVDLDTEENKDAITDLGCRYVMVRAEANDTIFTGDYRQIGLITDPRLSADNSLVSTTDASIGILQAYSGQLIYLENRDVQNITGGQSVDIKIIIRF